MRFRVFTALLLFGLAAFFSACQQPAATGLSAEDEAAIRAVLAEAMAIDKAPEKDFEAYVSTYYAEDGTIMPPNMPAVSGRAAMVAFFQAFPPYEKFEVKIIQLEGQGDWAYARGAEAPVKDTGKYIEIWKKAPDGGWKVYLDIFNSDLPLVASAAETD
jgi:ketosteroid isomerase-like protein